MADVRSLLRNERNARRISHPHATYSTTGTLVCLVCHIQLKSESLWNGHLRSAQHAMRLQRIRDGTLGRPPGAPAPEARQNEQDAEDETDGLSPLADADGRRDIASVAKSNKRKADDGEERLRKRSKAGDFPRESSEEGSADDSETTVLQAGTNGPSSGQEIQLPSRPATPLRTPEVSIVKKPVVVDEGEWAAFEADIAATEAPVVADAIISAPAMSTAELAAKSKEEENTQRKERHEAELEGDKEDAARKLEDELTEMEALEERVRKLKEKREALRLKDTSGNTAVSSVPPEVPTAKSDPAGINGGLKDDGEDEDEDDDDDDDWDGFRLRA